MVLMVATALFDHVFGSFPPETRTDRTLVLKMLRGEHMDKPEACISGHLATPFWNGMCPRWIMRKRCPFPQDFWSPEVTYRKGVKIESDLKYTDGVFWEILEFDFLEGRPYTTKEVEEAQRVAVINEETRRVFFGGEQAVGQYIEVKGRSFRVVGVVPNVPAFRVVSFADLWVPVSTRETDEYLHYDSIFGNSQALILARNAAEVPLIKEEFADVLTRVEYPDSDHDQPPHRRPCDAVRRGCAYDARVQGLRRRDYRCDVLDDWRSGVALHAPAGGQFGQYQQHSHLGARF